VILIDLSIPEPIAEALKKISNDVAYLYDVFPPGGRTRPRPTPDPVWLARAGQEGWLVVTRDHNIRYRPGERRAILEYGVGAFVLAHKAALPKWPYFKLLVATLDEMERRFESTPRPFLYTVSASGVFTQIELKAAP
jgi:hypothetical protein